MPQIFRIGSYIVYFWSNENDPLEPVHVHIAEGRASANATKIWITSTGKALLCNNNSKIPQKELRKMVRIIEANSALILDKWYSQFGEMRYYLLTCNPAYLSYSRISSSNSSFPLKNAYPSSVFISANSPGSTFFT